MGIKLIVTDLDGTLLRTDKTVSEETIQVLQKCREQTDRIIDMMQEAVPEAEIVSAADRTIIGTVCIFRNQTVYTGGGVCDAIQ